jgi:putative redox protein
MTATILYEGNLRTRCTHLQSGTEILTDAPRDNQGNGEAFSPTDLVATALATCIVTTMAIKCRQMNISIDGAKADVTKVMAADPRRIARIEVTLHMPAGGYTDKDKKILEHIANTCPVSLSLHPDLVQAVSFMW